MALQVITEMTEKEARACVTLIQGHIKNARAQIFELYQRDGWKALGYDSWSECVTSEFKQSRSYLYRQLSAAKVEVLIAPTAEVGKIPETRLRPLSALPDEKKVEVWEKATVNGMVHPSMKRIENLTKKALDGLSATDKKAVIEESEDQIIRRAAKNRRKQNAKEFLDWLDKWAIRALRKINGSGLNLKPLPETIKILQDRVARVRVRLLGPKRRSES